MKTLALAAALTLTCTAQAAAAQSVATTISAPVPAECRLSRPARVVTSLRALPEVAAEFRRIKLEIADVGEPFVPFDVVEAAYEALPRRQFVRGYVFGDRTIVWYYRGGLGTSFHSVELRMQQSDNRKGAPFALRLTGRVLTGPPCAATEALLAGVSGGPVW